MRIKYFLFGAAALALGACSNEENESISPSKQQTKEAYVQVTVKLPSASATRSETGNGGTTAEGVEIGQTTENTISKFQIVLIDKDGKIAKSDTITTGGNVPGSTDTYTTDPIKVQSLVAGTKYKTYILVNDSVDVRADDAYFTVSDADLTKTIAKANKFLMTGMGVDSVATGTDVTAYTKESPLYLGTVSVERAVARFDYKDYNDNGNVYVLAPGASSTDPAELQVKLTGIALTNVSPTFYMTKRVSADGTNASWTLGGAETPTNYVVDHNWADKTLAKWQAGTKAPFLNTYATGTGVTYKDLSSLSTDDNVWSSGSTYDGGGYKIWTYCTENTIQADPTVNQINGLSTGVIFKGEISGTMKAFNTTDAAFKATAGNKVYIFDGNVLGPWTSVVACKNADFSTITDPTKRAEMEALQTALKSAFVTQGLSETDDATLNPSAKLAAAGFTRYTADSAGKYYAYYVYWNRHNDNGVSNVMGPMEFAVVRNNVYKLAVTEIMRLGHPKDPTKPTPGTDPDPDPDPDEPDPEDPDEDPSIYLKVAVKVVPWTVRVNNITF